MKKERKGKRHCLSSTRKEKTTSSNMIDVQPELFQNSFNVYDVLMLDYKN